MLIISLFRYQQESESQCELLLILNLFLEYKIILITLAVINKLFYSSRIYMYELLSVVCDEKTIQPNIMSNTVT